MNETAAAPAEPETTAPGSITDESLAAVIEAFYCKVRQDAALGPMFARAIADHEWPAHLATIRDFWSSVMLKTGRYKGNPFAVHLGVVGISPALFGRWLALFGETCREHLAPDAAAVLHGRAERIAESLQAGLFFRPTLPVSGAPPLPRGEVESAEPTG